MLTVLMASSAEAMKITPAGASASSLVAAALNPLVVVDGSGLGPLFGQPGDPNGNAHSNHQDYVPPGSTYVPNMWVSYAETSHEYFEVDLGANFTLGAGAMRVWNYNHTTVNRGMKSVKIEVLADDGSSIIGCTGGGATGSCTHPTSAASYSQVSFSINGSSYGLYGDLSEAPGTHAPGHTGDQVPSFNYDTPDTIDFQDNVTARFIRMTALTVNDYPDAQPTYNGQWGNLGLAEIQVYQIPEPSSVILLGLGLMGLAAHYRRRS